MTLPGAQGPTSAELLVLGLVGLATWLLLPPPPGRTMQRDCRALLPLAAAAAAWFAAAGFVPGQGLVLALLLAAAALAAAHIGRRLRARRARELAARRVVEACEVIAAELSAGRPAGGALQEAAGGWAGLAPVAEAHLLGSDVAEALRRQATSPGAEDLRLVAAAWQVAHRSGHGLAAAVDRVARGLRARHRSRRVVESELASARATARLVAVLPLVALVMGSGAGGSPWAFLFGTPLGLVCLGAGLALGLVGLGWIERIADQVDRS